MVSGRLTGGGLLRVMIAVLGGLADVDRDLIPTGPQRAAAGRRTRAARGPPAKIDRRPKAEARRRRAEGATLAELARSYHVGKSTISRLRDTAKQRRD